MLKAPKRGAGLADKFRTSFCANDRLVTQDWPKGLESIETSIVLGQLINRFTSARIGMLT